ncbi:MAG: HAD family hydrolase [Granulosicoccaceae bacterium]
MRHTKLIAFDFDGVIVDSASTYVQSINHVGQCLGANKLLSIDQLALMPDYRHQFSAEMIELPRQQFSAFSEQLSLRFHRVQERAKLHRAMGLLLANCLKRGEVVILSANEQRVIEMALSELALDSIPIYARCGREAKANVLADLAQRARVLMVGDTLSDCRAAASAGVDCVSVAWGWQGRERLLEAKVPLMASVEELHHWLVHWSQLSST